MLAREHAVTSSQLLANVEKFQERLGNLTPDQQLQRAVTGEIKRDNADIEHTIAMATAHALAAIALTLTKDEG